MNKKEKIVEELTPEVPETEESMNTQEVGEEVDMETIPVQNYRECTCGEMVVLPDGSAEDTTTCICGVKHAR